MTNPTAPFTHHNKIRHAFSMIELLVVISIIVTLTGLLVAGVVGMRGSTEVIRTQTIIETIRQAIQLTASERGSPAIPAEHPLAGSQGTSSAPRFVFQRSANNGGALLNSTIAQTFPAIKGVSLSQIPSSYRERLLLDDDVYADERVPSLYGLERERIGYLGANLNGIQYYHDIPAPGGTLVSHDSAAMTSMLNNPVYIKSSTDSDTANAMLIDYVLGSTTAKTELSKLNSKSHLNELDALYVGGGDGSYAINSRVWNPLGQTSPNWEPGHVYDENAANWIRYRIRGLALYDAWGREIIYTLSNKGNVRLMSAGPDGVFVRSPGEDGTFQSSAIGPVIGDDIEGTNDNIILVTDDV